MATTIETSVVGICFAVFQMPRSGVERIEKSKSVGAVGASGLAAMAGALFLNLKKRTLR